MSTSYVESGRVRQKERTRQQLLDAARRLIERGDTPRVEEVAEASGISRTTAYRYFPSQTQLLAAAFPETSSASLLPDPAPAGAPERVAAVAVSLIDIVARSEAQQRAMLRHSLGDVAHDLPLRQGRAIGWFREALEPLRKEYGDATVRRLAQALRSVCGIETRVWLADVAELDPKRIGALQLWMVDALVAHAERTPPPR